MLKKLSVFIALLLFIAFSHVAAGASEVTRESKISSQFECLYKFTALKKAEDDNAESDVLGNLKENYNRELTSYNHISKAYSRSIPGNNDTGAVSIENNGPRRGSSEVILHIGPKHGKDQKLKRISVAYVLNLVLGYYGQDEEMRATLENLRQADPKEDCRNTIIGYLGDRSVGVLVKNDAMIEDVKEFIDSKNPVICYVGVKNISHWAVVVGYAKDTDESVSAVYVRDAFWGRKKEYRIPVEIFLKIWKHPEAGKKISLEEKDACSNYMIATFGTQPGANDGGVTPPPPPPVPGTGGADDSSPVAVNDPPIQNHDTAETQTPFWQIQARLEILKAITDIVKKLMDLQTAILAAITGTNAGGQPVTGDSSGTSAGKPAEGKPVNDKPAEAKPVSGNKGNGNSTVATNGVKGISHNVPPAWGLDRNKNKNKNFNGR